MRYNDEGETNELCKWTVDLSSLPTFRQNAFMAPMDGFYTGKVVQPSVSILFCERTCSRIRARFRARQRRSPWNPPLQQSGMGKVCFFSYLCSFHLEVNVASFHRVTFDFLG